MTGFDRMLIDKMNFFRTGGYWFAFFGVANLMAYGASLIMNKDWYRFHFSYNAEASKLFSPIKGMIGSDNLMNVAWTAPCLIGFNLYMQKKVGSLVMTKFFFLSLFSSYIFLSSVSPKSGLNYRPIHGFLPKWDAYADDGSYYMGADQMAQSLIYFTLLYHRLWLVALPCMAFDILYMGPSTIGGPAAAIAGALMFL